MATFKNGTKVKITEEAKKDYYINMDFKDESLVVVNNEDDGVNIGKKIYCVDTASSETKIVVWVNEDDLEEEKLAS